MCGSDVGTDAEPVTATTVTYGGKKFDIIGYNKNGLQVGVAGSNNSVTLLLDKTEVYIYSNWNPSANGNTYQGSTISTKIDTFANSTLSTNDGIIARTLTGGSNTYTAPSGYNEDYIKGPDVTNQKVWPLSIDEASHLIVSTRVFPDVWWLRTPGNYNNLASAVGDDGYIEPNGSFVNVASTIRPALYLDINSSALSSVIASAAWQSNSIPIGACQAQSANLGINYNAETVTGLDTDTPGWSLAPTFIGLLAPSVQTSAPIDISSNISNTASNLYFYKASMNTNIYFNSNTDSNGDAQESKSKLIIPARPAGPSVTGVAPGDVGASDGKITGTSNKMEYSTDEVSWTAVGGSAITGLTSGTYFVRTIADQSASKFKSFAKEVIIKEGSSPSAGPSVGKPGSGSGPSTGDGGFSSEGTAQTGIDLTTLELLALLMVASGFSFRRYFWHKLNL